MRFLIPALIIVCCSFEARAATWVTSEDGTFGCADRAAMTELQSARGTDKFASLLSEKMEAGLCAHLLKGERLVDAPEENVAWSPFTRLRRDNGQTLYVDNNNIVPHGGCNKVKYQTEYKGL